jgi:hypothetical protein
MLYYVYCFSRIAEATNKLKGERHMSNTVQFTSKQSKVLSALTSGEALTAKQIEARFGVGNARSTVSALRMKGYAIFLNNHKDTKGRQTQKYRIGSAPRAVVAAGYKALAAQGESVHS